MIPHPHPGTARGANSECGTPGALGALLRRALRPWRGRFERRQLEFLLRQRDENGGFRGRQGGGDLYYTRFALRTLDALGWPAGLDWTPTAQFVRRQAPAASDPIAIFCAIDAAAVLAAAAAPPWSGEEQAQAEAKLIGRLDRLPAQTSLYDAFLAALARVACRSPAPSAESVEPLLQACKRPDGGFAESPAGTAGQTNPTAAAVGLMDLTGLLQRPIADGIAEFLLGMRRPDGGFAAHAAAPVSDLLSTFTALVSLRALDRLRQIRLSAAGRYVQSLARPQGGFAGWTADGQPDAEFTYYGLGSLGLLAEAAGKAPQARTDTD